jgi:hypothetical protein
MSNEPFELSDAETGWVSRACTLPTADQPLRVAEFDELFRSGLRGLDRLAPTRLQLRLDAASEANARELTTREANCCSFFGFDYTSVDGRLLLEITVPATQVDVLDALAARAAGLAA